MGLIPVFMLGVLFYSFFFKVEMLSLLLFLEFFFVVMLAILLGTSFSFFFSCFMMTLASCEAVFSLTFLLHFSTSFKSYFSLVWRSKRESPKFFLHGLMPSLTA